MESFNSQAEDSERFEGTGRVLRESPPRQLNWFTKLSILLGGSLQQMGWAFAGFGMIFFWVFVMNSEAKYLLSFDGEWVNTQGVVEYVEVTNAEINDQQVYAYHLQYSVEGQTKKGVIYGTYRLYAYHLQYSVEGQTKKGVIYGTYRPNLEPNRSVRVEYKSRNHSRIRGEGLSSTIFPIWTLFVCIFPIIGFSFLFTGFFYNLKALRLFIHGKFTKGKLSSKMATNTRINEQIVYKYHFEFQDNGQDYQATCSTHQCWKVEDEALEIILYDERNPSNSIVYDSVAAAPEINPRGELEPASFRLITLFILPVISIVVNALMYYFFVVLDVF